MNYRAVFALSAAAVVAPIFCPSHASAGVPMPYATEFTQILNGLKLLQQLMKEAQMVQNELTQIQYMVYNTKDITKHPFTAITADLNGLSNVIINSQGLAYGLGQMDQQLSKMYPSYDPHQEWFDHYSDWANNTMNTIRGTLSSAGIQGNALNSESSVMNQIRAMAQTPMGQNQVAQVGVVLSTEMVSQLQKLRQLIIVNAQQQAAVQGMQLQHQTATQQSQTQAFATNSWAGDGKGY